MRFRPRYPKILQCIVTIVLLLGGHHHSPRTQAADWRVGVAFDRQLDQHVGLSWTSMPLRRGLEDLSRSQQVAVFIDRRVDPGQKVTLSLSNVSLETVFETIATQQQLCVCHYGSIMYFGHTEAVSKLRTLAALRSDDLRRLSTDTQRKWRRRNTLSWPDFATPRKILTRWGQQNDVRIDRIERVPHDLWAAAELPGLSLLDQLTLIVDQFDLTFKLSKTGDVVRLISAPSDAKLVRSYPGGQNPARLADKWKKLIPECEIKIVDKEIYVRGPLEAHERIAPTHRPTSRSTKIQGGELRIAKLTVKDQPLGELLEQLTKRLGLQLQIDRKALAKAGISLDQRISIEVENTTIDDLFRSILSPRGLTFQRRKSSITVRPTK